MTSRTAAKPAIVVFGSKVMADGTPSGSLRRRTLGALRWADANGVNPVYVVSGGRARDDAPEEAIVMRELLIAHGADARDILTDTAAVDTLQNVMNSVRILERLAVDGALDRIFVCSDDYHVPRCWLLMRLVKRRLARADARLECRPIFLRGSRAAVGTFTWLGYCLHEARAIVRDARALGVEADRSQAA